MDEGVIKKTMHCVVKSLGETKKSKSDDGKEYEFAIGIVEDQERGEEFKIILSLSAFAELQEGDLVFLKHFYAKPDKYTDDEMMVLSKGKFGQMIKVDKK